MSTKKKAPAKKKAAPAGATIIVGKRALIAQDAANGKLPAPPDFSNKTHERFRPKLAELVKLVKARDIAGLKAFEIKPISTSPKALDRFRNLAVIALEAQKAKG